MIPSRNSKHFALERTSIILNVLFVIIRITTSAPSVSVDRTESNELDHKSIPSNGSYSTANEMAKNDVCLTAGCAKAASRLRERLDVTAIDPCNDFYNFACGNFVKETVIPDDEDKIDGVSIVQKKINEQLRSLFSENIDSNDPMPFNIAKRLYNTCMNESSLEAHGLQPLQSILDKFGGWPVVKGDQWNENADWNWTWAVKEFRKIGYEADYIIGLKVGSNLENTTTQMIYIDQGATVLGEYLLTGPNENILNAYKKYMIETAVTLGADRIRAENELNETLEFEKALTSILLPENQAEHYILSLRDVQENYMYIQWVEYINALLPEPLSVNEDDSVVIKVPSYLLGLEQLLNDTSARVMANYMMWRITESSASYLTKELYKLKFEFSKVGNGHEKQKQIWKKCIDSVAAELPIVVSAMYVRKYFREDSKAAVSEIMNGIQNEFVHTFKEASWMNEKARQYALEKLSEMHPLIGYPDELMDDSKIEKYYEKLEINENNYLSFALSLNSFNDKYSLGKLYAPVNKSDWETRQPAFTVNAFYLNQENSIQFPAAILQGGIFSADRPRYLNFGSIGFIIGHEIAHGFDDTGTLFDHNGNLVFQGNMQLHETYMERSKCIMKQYMNFTEPLTGLKINSSNTQAEDMSDNEGIKLAYAAYRKWVQKNGAEPKLPGLNYTQQQMFWISAAQTWCSVSRPELMEKQIVKDVHTPNQFRVLGSFSNLKEFANDFQCPEGSPMNPVKKCEVW